MQRNGIYGFTSKAATAVKRLELPFFFVMLGLIVLSHWLYLLAIGALNGQPLSWLQSALVAVSSWVPYAPLFLIGRAVIGTMKMNRARLISILIPALGIGAALILAWQTFAVLKIVPSGHSFAHIFGAKLRSELIQTLIFMGLLLGLLYAVRRPASNAPPSIQIKDGHTTHQIPSNLILYLQAEDYYVRLYTAERSFLVRRPLYELLDILSDFGFVKVSRSAVVSLRHIKALRTDKKGGLNVEIMNAHTLKVGKSFRKALKIAWSATVQAA